MNEILDDEQLAQMIRGAYRDVDLARPLPDTAPARGVASLRGPRLVFAAAFAVVLILAGAFLAGVFAGGGGPQNLPQPADPSPTPSIVAGAKPPRPTSSATTDDGKCADYAKPATLPPLRFAIKAGTLTDVGEMKLRAYASNDDVVLCWLYADQVTVNGPSTSVQTPGFPAGELSYVSFAEGHVDTQVAFGRAPAGTTKVEVFAPGDSPIVATLDGEWYVVAVSGDKADRLSEVTKVVAHTPSGERTLVVRHG